MPDADRFTISAAIVCGEGVKDAVLDLPSAIGSDYVFTNPDGNHLDPRRVSSWLARRVAASGLPRIRFHDLRHAFAHALIAAGASITELKELVGHSSVQTTIDIYGGLFPGATRSAIDHAAALSHGGGLRAITRQASATIHRHR